MGKVLKWGLAGLILVFVVIQFKRPDRTNPATDDSLFVANHVSVPPDIRAILERSCFDCHSDRTVWPWYSEIAPVSWLVADDVEEGRKHLNFSRWGAYAQARQMTALGDIADEVGDGGMPLPNYIIIHSEAKLDSAARALIAAWADSEREKIAATQGDEK